MKKFLSAILLLIFILGGCTTTDSQFSETIAKQALQTKHPDWDMSELIVTIDRSDENFATGTVSDGGPGGGAYFAANTDDGWVIAWDGNGSIGCADIEPYNFPADIIGECYDYSADEVIIR